ncbi:alpha-1,2-mannosidase [Streptomyces sp. NBC_01485]|uniref:alpha-1,2-mannosidase n=1 Tax=Streptomyces sp. NBC_01485 TaxID=2903884 RepID=UPI002E3182D7|nr:alpha-1,2-mannosidase [Streptomyces sp. NBC_01485]
MSLQATFADFSVEPALLSNAEVQRHGCGFAGDHLALDAGGSVTLEFEVVDPEAIPQATLTVTGLVSRLGSSPGYAPIDVLLQGEALAEELTVPGGGDLPTDNVFAVPARLLKPGGNTLEIRTSAEARSMFWLYRITLDSIDERGRSERARAAQAAQDSVFAYRTELRAPFADTSSSSSESWEVGPRLLFHIDRDEHSLPAQLNWRAADGAESAISFQSNMSGFHGSHRAADGTVYEYRGHLNGSWAFPEGLDDASESRLHRFRTEEGWGGGWHASHELRLLVDDGPVPVERVSWRDQRGNSGVVMLQSATGDLKVTGVAASEEFDGGGEGAANLLDDARNKWLAFDDTALLDFTLARPAVVSSYSLRSANDAPGRDPRDWTLLGSFDGHTWTPLDTRTGETFTSRFQTRDFVVRGAAHTTAYRHYRLEISSNSGSNETQLAQVRFVEAPTGQGFVGYYQRYNEGPIGYRGTPVPAPKADGVPATSVAADLEAAVQSLTDTAQTLAALAARLRGR